MFQNSDELLKFVKDEGVEMVDVRFVDLPGIEQHFTVPVSSFDQAVFDDGLAFDGSSIRGFQAINESDMALFPDPTTAYLDPFRTTKTLNLSFFIHDPITGEAYSRDPRNIARKALAYLGTTGIADTAYFAPEAEFYIFDSVRYSTGANEGYYHIDSVEGWWNSGKEGDNRGYKTRFKGGYFPVAPYDHYGDLRDEMVKNLEACGLLVERAHHEVGTAGQAEINYRFDTLLKAADDVMKFKYLIKNTAWEAGKSVTFMPKPIFGDNGSGMHVHQSLWKDGDPLFYDETGYGGLSDMARWYIGGILAARPVAAGVHQPDGELLPPPGAGLRGPDLAGVLLAQPLRVGPHPDHRLEPEGQAHRDPVPRPVGEPLPRVLGPDARRRRRHQEQDRAGRPDRQGHLRAPAGRDGRDRPGPDLARRRARRARGRPRLPDASATSSRPT